MHLQLWENVIFILMKESESQDVKSEFRGKKSELWVLWKKAGFQKSRIVYSRLQSPWTLYAKNINQPIHSSRPDVPIFLKYTFRLSLEYTTQFLPLFSPDFTVWTSWR